MTNGFHWNELVTHDPQTAADFYREVLAIESRSVDMGPMGEYTILAVDGHDVGGILAAPSEQPVSTWMSYFFVDDVDTAVARVTSAGGRVETQPFDVPGVGRISTIVDPTGGRLALMTPAASASSEA